MLIWKKNLSKNTVFHQLTFAQNIVLEQDAETA